MVGYCSALNCTQRSTKGISFFSFPKDENLRKLWILATKRKNFTPSNSSLLCINHFLKSDIVRNFGKISLKKGTVPSRFNFNNYSKKKKGTKEPISLLDEDYEIENINKPASRSNIDCLQIEESTPQKKYSINLQEKKIEEKFTNENLIINEVCKEHKIVEHFPPVTNVEPEVPVIDITNDDLENVPINDTIKKTHTNGSQNKETLLNKNITKDNFQEICRCCLINKGEVNIFEGHFQNIPFSDLIKFCLNENVSCDDLPNTVCNICMQLLISSFTFLKKVKDVQKHIQDLKKMFSQSENSNKSLADLFGDIQPVENILKNSNKNNASCSTEPENFKHKFRHLNRIYKELCDVMLENKRQIKRSSKKKDRPSRKKIDDTKVPESVINTDATENFNEKGDKIDISSTLNTVKNSMNENEIEGSQNLITEYSDTEEKTVVENENVFKSEDVISSEVHEEEINTGTANVELFTLQGDYVEKSIKDLISCEFDDIRINNEGDSLKFEIQREESEIHCFECSQTLKDERAYLEHCRGTGHIIPHRFKCNQCSATFQLGRLYRRHMKNHQSKKNVFICEICGVKIIHFSNLKRHLESHTNKNSNVCQFCGRTFTQKGALQTHIKFKHLEEVNALCFLCGLSFESVSKLNKHLNDEHLEDGLENKSYACDVCEKYFISEVCLNMHIKYTHIEKIQHRFATNKRTKRNIIADINKIKGPKQCPICFQTFKHSGLKTHIMMKHENKGYRCRICRKVYRYPALLKSHMKLHLKPYKCRYCLTHFKTNSHLEMHLAMHHTDVTTYECPVCDQSFHKLSIMKIHHRKHFETESNENNIDDTEEIDEDIDEFLEENESDKESAGSGAVHFSREDFEYL